MTWVAWRQHRAALLLLVAFLAAGALSVGYLGTQMQSFITARGLANCVKAVGECGSASGFDTPFADRFDTLLSLAKLVMLTVPIVIGMFLGAPLFAREFENRTHLLILGQAISLRRWVSTKIATVFVPALLGVAALTLAYAWMLDVPGALLGEDNRFGAVFFEAQGLMPVLYTLFALGAGVAFGLLLRNTVAAIAATLGLFVVARIGLQFARPHLLPPTLLKGPLTYPDLPAGSLLVNSGYLDKAGNVVGEEALPLECRSPDIDSIEACVGQHGFTGTAQYFHGPDHYWILQLIEGGILLAVAATLLAAGVWRFRARLR